MKFTQLPPDLESEYKEFLNSSPVEVPKDISNKIIKKIHEELNPSKQFVFLKLATIVLIVGVLNLTLCPQFGIGFIRHTGLMHYFMSFGEYGCRIACGVFFLGSGMLTASLLLKPEDIRVIRNSRLLFISAISMLSLIAFVALGGEVYFEASLFWFAGTIAGGIGSIEMGWAFRKMSFSY